MQINQCDRSYDNHLSEYKTTFYKIQNSFVLYK